MADGKSGCCCYHKGTYFQANHNHFAVEISLVTVVVATTKVHIFKQITTVRSTQRCVAMLLLLPQRYIFSSKSQLPMSVYPPLSTLLLLPQRYIFSSKSQLYKPFPLFRLRCCCYHKGTYFQANHNRTQCSL